MNKSPKLNRKMSDQSTSKLTFVNSLDSPFRASRDSKVEIKKNFKPMQKLKIIINKSRAKYNIPGQNGKLKKNDSFERSGISSLTQYIRFSNSYSSNKNYNPKLKAKQKYMTSQNIKEWNNYTSNKHNLRRRLESIGIEDAKLFDKQSNKPKSTSNNLSPKIKYTRYKIN